MVGDYGLRHIAQSDIFLARPDCRFPGLKRPKLAPDLPYLVLDART